MATAYLLPGTTVPAVAQPAAGKHQEMLHRVVLRPGSSALHAACGLPQPSRLDPATAIPVDQADPTLLCRGSGCRMRAWPARPRRR